MVAHTLRFFTLFSSVIVLLTGHGLQLTLLPLRAEAIGWTPDQIGITGSTYFAGFLLGCTLIPNLVARVGHIRVFSATTTLCGLALLFIMLSDNVVIWSILRLLTGVGISGSYVIIESWLNAEVEDRYRGRLLAVYTMLVLGSMTIGQMLVNAGSPATPTLIVLGTALLSVAIMPLTLARIEQPAPPPTVDFPLRLVSKASPAAVGGGSVGTNGQRGLDCDDGARIGWRAHAIPGRSMV